MKITGVVLTGGKSIRMGEDKGLKEIEGKPMAQWVLDLLEPLCDELVISANFSLYKKFGYTCIADQVPNIGPIGGVHAVMNAIESDFYFFVSCDMPKASVVLARRLIEEIFDHEVIVPQHSGGKIEPLFGIYKATVLAKANKQIDKQNYKLMDLLKECDTFYYQVPSELMKQEPNMFKNYNTPQDFE